MYVYTVHDYTIILLRTRILVGETGFDPKTIVFVLYVSGSGLKCLTRIWNPYPVFLFTLPDILKMFFFITTAELFLKKMLDWKL